jgi:hypothetical protein
MSTPSKAPRRPAKPRPADTCRLTVTIRGMAYGARPIACETGRAWRLRNLENGRTYDVAETEHGPTCDCADAVYRHDGTDGAFCKHVRALSALNLITLDVESDPSTWPSWCDAHTYAIGR